LSLACSLPSAQTASVTQKRAKQRTLQSKISSSGVGLFSGENGTITLCPAPPNHGIVFQRVDIPDKPRIPARLDFIHAMPRCTAIGIGHATIQTVEHLLSAIYGSGVDNLLIEVSGPEVPIFDGSASRFVQMFEEAGYLEQNEEKVCLKLAHPLSWSKDDVHLMALPSDEFRVSYTLHYPQSSTLCSQFFSTQITQEIFACEISPCRTFSLYEEVEPFIHSGLIKGGSLENAVVIKEDKIVNPEGLRFSDEMVRHKILDLVGDFSLLGYPLQAHLIAIRSGHSSNIAFAKILQKYLNPVVTNQAQGQEVEPMPKKLEKMRMSQESFKESVVLDIKGIKKILPHRYPFLLVDRIVYLNLEEGLIIGQKNVTGNEEFFQGHFPQVPLMPGFLILEALAQAGGVLIHQKGHKDKLAVLLNVNNGKFRKPVVPGDSLMLHAKALHVGSKGGKILGRAFVHDQLVAEAEIGFALVEWEKL